MMLTAACSKPAPPEVAATAERTDRDAAVERADRDRAAPREEVPEGGRRRVRRNLRRYPPPNLNVLLITVDSLRADMPWAGYPRAIAPNLTALEKRAVSYTHAYSLSSYTSMSLGGCSVAVTRAR